MTLASLIRKRDTGTRATAIPAIAATQQGQSAMPVARIATVAVANPKEGQAAPPKIGAGDTASTSRWWQLHYPDREPVEVACCPKATHAEILERHPDAIAAEPFAPIGCLPSVPMTAHEEQSILAWLAQIEETTPATIADVFQQCQTDADARDYFIQRAAAGRGGCDV